MTDREFLEDILSDIRIFNRFDIFSDGCGIDKFYDENGSYTWAHNLDELKEKIQKHLDSTKE